MTDRELRDKLANEFWPTFNTDIAASIHATTVFKAGWNAARAHEKNQIAQAIGTLIELLKEYAEKSKAD